MGEHIDNRKNGAKRHKKGYAESVDPLIVRKRRATFKSYLRDIEEELLEADLETEDEPDDSEPNN